jgi:hypothetical protein
MTAIYHRKSRKTKPAPDDGSSGNTMMQQLEEAMAQAAFFHGDQIYATDAYDQNVMGGTFLSNCVEGNAGSLVIPLALKFARFLLPALHADRPVVYDLVQPHRYGYVFQIRSVGGWRLLGAVNMHASPEVRTLAMTAP